MASPKLIDIPSGTQAAPTMHCKLKLEVVMPDCQETRKAKAVGLANAKAIVND